MVQSDNVTEPEPYADLVGVGEHAVEQRLRRQTARAHALGALPGTETYGKMGTSNLL